MSRKLLLMSIAALLLFAACSKPAQTNQNANESSAPAQSDSGAQTGAPTPLMNAVTTGDVEEVRRLLDSNVPVDAATGDGVTPLMNAAGMGNKEMAQMLMAKGANVNAKTNGNYTVLMAAALTGQLEMVRILLDAGADPKVKDVGGKTAASYAQEKNHKEIADLLKRRGGA
jgi:ankyrin repeat protein